MTCQGLLRFYMLTPSLELSIGELKEELVLCIRMPFLRNNIERVAAHLLHVCRSRVNMRAHRLRARETSSSFTSIEVGPYYSSTPTICKQ
ncbi:hypothetical protein Btru_043706 [Bulinus truncatus]|nr:hypothetical protein Btru_043706 [Bulinus truncatus]